MTALFRHHCRCRHVLNGSEFQQFSDRQASSAFTSVQHYSQSVRSHPRPRKYGLIGHHGCQTSRLEVADGRSGSLKYADRSFPNAQHSTLSSPRHRRQLHPTQGQYKSTSASLLAVAARNFSTATPSQAVASNQTPVQMSKDKAYIALGSNVGDRLANLDEALAALEGSRLHVCRTSALYETAPMYVEDQASFLNAVCEIDIPSGLTPLALLDRVKELESKLGRVKTIEKGPRAIDLDILAFGQETVDHERLSIPHHSILEREFVLRPLADLIPNHCLPGVLEDTTVASHLEALPRDIHFSVTPLRPNVPHLTPGKLGARTLVMGIFNMTPDSFSDGGKNSVDPTSPQMQEQLASWLEAGADILDIGGQSTAPNAPAVTAKDEMDRVLPLIRHIRADSRFDNVVLSIDTYRASVARAAVEVGADIVNDVSAGTLDPEMIRTVAQLRVPIVLMHMRGDPSTMQKQCNYPNGLLQTVAQELGDRVDAAMVGGIPRWKIILDPGIGFAKQKRQNVELLKDMGELAAMKRIRGFPWLVGTSRKAWIGHVAGVKQASQRDWGTAAAVTASIAAGANIVRIHQPKLAQTVKVADAIWNDTHEW